jgi:hypothetical protein
VQRAAPIDRYLVYFTHGTQKATVEIDELIAGRRLNRFFHVKAAEAAYKAR